MAQAGQPSRITVATNMAGRGTDIQLDPEVVEMGGLHVILTEFHDSARIDRQLYGRCARQGNPGSVEAIVSLEDELFRHFLGRFGLVIQRFGGAKQSELLRRWAQYCAEQPGSKPWRKTGGWRGNLPLPVPANSRDDAPASVQSTG